MSLHIASLAEEYSAEELTLKWRYALEVLY
jgi:hypothetical protein